MGGLKAGEVYIRRTYRVDDTIGRLYLELQIRWGRPLRASSEVA